MIMTPSSPSLLTYESLMIILQKTVFHRDDAQTIKELWKGREYQRATVMDLMYEICISSKLNLDTAFIARKYFDLYFLDKKSITNDDNLLLVGLSCLLLASCNTDEIPIPVDVLLKYVDNQFTEDMIWSTLCNLRNQHLIDNMTELFIILVCKEVIQRWIKPDINIHVKKVHTLAYFFASMTLMNVEMSHLNPKLIGVGSMIIALISYGFDRHASFLFRNCGVSVLEMSTICDVIEKNYKKTISFGDNFFINRFWKMNKFDIHPR